MTAGLRRDRIILSAIILANVVLNLSMIGWGLPDSWSPDEVVKFVLHMGKERSPDYGNYKYPAFHIYTIALAFTPYYLAIGRHYAEPYPPRFFAETLLIGRAFTVLYSALALWVLYHFAVRMFSRRVAQYATALLAVNPLYLTYGHQALLDIPQLFWMLATLYWCLEILERGRMRDYGIAGVLAGMTIATKYYWFIALMIVTAHFLRREREMHKLFLAGSACAAVFLVLNPMLFVHFDIVKAAVTRLAGDSMSYFGLVGRRGFSAHPYNLLFTLGVPLCLAAVLGLWHLAKTRTRATSARRIFFGTWLVVNAVIFGMSRATPMRYLLPMLPFLIMAGSVYLIERKSRWLHWAVVLFAAIGLCTALAATWWDSRYAAGEWLSQLPPEKTIGVFDRIWNPHFPIDQYYSIHSKSREAFVQITQNITDDYLVVVSLSYGRYFCERKYTGLQDCTRMPERTAYFRELLNGEGGYRVVAEFDTVPWHPLLPIIELTDPEITVVQRVVPTGEDDHSGHQETLYKLRILPDRTV